MNQKERMLSGLPYKAWMDGLMEERLENKKRIYEFNHCPPGDGEKINSLIRSILGKAGKGVHIEAPFHCDYGKNIEVGDYFFANYNCIILDVGKVVIGNNVMFSPNVCFYKIL
jgi:acetyltransferase-like isoleucine patch superfamily enzyme